MNGAPSVEPPIVDTSSPPSTMDKPEKTEKRKYNKTAKTTLANKKANNTSAVNNGETCAKKSATTSVSSTDSISCTAISGKRTVGTLARSIATSTDQDCLGPCEPGTHVTLDGVVWNELESGMLVVNVTWRGKSYVGSLLDCSRYDWAPPRVSESPLLELTPAKHRNGKRRAALSSNSSSAAASTSNLTNGKANGRSNALKLTVSVGNTNGSDDDATISMDGENSTSNHVGEPPLSPVMRVCPCLSCGKKFVSNLALKYHQNASHRPSGSNSSNNTSVDVSPTPAAKRTKTNSGGSSSNEDAIVFAVPKVDDRPAVVNNPVANMVESILREEQTDSIQRLMSVVAPKPSSTPTEPAFCSVAPTAAAIKTDVDTDPPSGAYSDISDEALTPEKQRKLLRARLSTADAKPSSTADAKPRSSETSPHGLQDATGHTALIPLDDADMTMGGAVFARRKSAIVDQTPPFQHLPPPPVAPELGVETNVFTLLSETMRSPLTCTDGVYMPNGQGSSA